MTLSGHPHSWRFYSEFYKWCCRCVPWETGQTTGWLFSLTWNRKAIKWIKVSKSRISQSRHLHPEPRLLTVASGEQQGRGGKGQKPVGWGRASSERLALDVGDHVPLLKAGALVLWKTTTVFWVSLHKWRKPSGWISNTPPRLSLNQ